MPLGTEVGFGPDDIVLDGEPLPVKKGHSPSIFGLCCGQTAGCIKMPLGTEVGLGPGDIVLDGHPAPLPKKWDSPQIFGLCLLWLNGRPFQLLLSS